MDETDIRVKGQWSDRYRAVEKTGQTIGFWLTEHREKEAGLHFLQQALRRHGLPETITIDGSEAYEAAIKHDNEEHGLAIVIRKMQYLHHVVEQDQREVKWIIRPILRTVRSF